MSVRLNLWRVTAFLKNIMSIFPLYEFFFPCSCFGSPFPWERVREKRTSRERTTITTYGYLMNSTSQTAHHQLKWERPMPILYSKSWMGKSVDCRLDSKYSRIMTKNRNVPIVMIMISNEIQ